MLRTSQPAEKSGSFYDCPPVRHLLVKSLEPHELPSAKCFWRGAQGFTCILIAFLKRFLHVKATEISNCEWKVESILLG